MHRYKYFMVTLASFPVHALLHAKRRVFFFFGSDGDALCCCAAKYLASYTMPRGSSKIIRSNHVILARYTLCRPDSDACCRLDSLPSLKKVTNPNFRSEERGVGKECVSR